MASCVLLFGSGFNAVVVVVGILTRLALVDAAAIIIAHLEWGGVASANIGVVDRPILMLVSRIGAGGASVATPRGVSGIVAKLLLTVVVVVLLTYPDLCIGATVAAVVGGIIDVVLALLLLYVASNLAVGTNIALGMVVRLAVVVGVVVWVLLSDLLVGGPSIGVGIVVRLVVSEVTLLLLGIAVVLRCMACDEGSSGIVVTAVFFVVTMALLLLPERTIILASQLLLVCTLGRAGRRSTWSDAAGVG